MINRRALGCAAFVILAAGVPMKASAQCSCEPTTDPSFTRTILTAYAGEFDAFVAAAGAEGRDAKVLRSIGKLFQETEKLVRKGQVLQISGNFDSAHRRYGHALGVIDELGTLIDKAGQAGLLASTPGDKLGDRRAALSVEVARINENPPGESCYHACKEVCGDKDMNCNGLAATGKCQCMLKSCYPYCKFIPSQTR